MVKLVYTYALGAYALRRAGSSPVSRTKKKFLFLADYFLTFKLSANLSMLSFIFRLDVDLLNNCPINLRQQRF